MNRNRSLGIIFFAIFTFFAILAGPVMAKDYSGAPAVPEPVVDGNDVIFSDTDMREIPDYNGDNVKIRVHDAVNVWGYTIKREGPNNWRAVGVRGMDIHPYVGDPLDNYKQKQKTNFIKAEKYSDRPFYKERAMGPCFNFK